MQKQLKHTVTYRQNDVEKEIYDWIEEKRGVFKAADFIKTILLEKKNELENNPNNIDKKLF